MTVHAGTRWEPWARSAITVENALAPKQLMTNKTHENNLDEIAGHAAATFGLRLTAVEVLRDGRATVVRATCRDGHATRDVVIKRFKTPNNEHYLRARSGLSLFAATPSLDGFVPKLIGVDDGSRTLVTEFVPESESYTELVASSSQLSLQILKDTARQLGELHGYAQCRVQEFSALVPRPATPGTILRSSAPATLSFIARVFACDGAPPLGLPADAILTRANERSRPNRPTWSSVNSDPGRHGPQQHPSRSEGPGIHRPRILRRAQPVLRRDVLALHLPYAKRHH